MIGINFKSEMEEKEEKELFAQYGKVVYMVQCIEKGILGLVVYNSKNIIRNRYKELLFEKFQFTFGQLMRELKEKNIFTPEQLRKFDTFHSIRDDLIHNFWWDRAVELSKPYLRSSILKELEMIESKLSHLNYIIDVKQKENLEENNIDIKSIEEELLRLSKIPSIEVFRKLKKNETVINIQSYNLNLNSIIPIFNLEDNTFWTVCESGLSQYKDKLIVDKLNDISYFKELFPIRQFNPRPSKNADWDYDFDLKKQGLKMQIRPVSIKGAIGFNWIVSKK